MSDQCTKDVTCESTQTKCGGSCVDVSTNTAHCGKCDNKCQDGQACVDGTCEKARECTDGKTACSTDCVDLNADASHCGSCNNQCKDGESCNSGKCEAKQTCQNGQTDCAGTCVDTDADKDNCGACDNKCPTGQSCDSGSCKCDGGQTDCAGTCVDTDTDKDNCGACDNKCQSSETCKAGRCELDCESGKQACAGSCVDTDTDKDNCGACGNQCGEGLVCRAGSCGCPDGQSRCSGKCVDTSQDPKNCGQCGYACKDLEVCSSSQCKSTCDPGKTGCSGACVDTDTDINNCGACGNKCGSGKSCCAGQCIDLQNDPQHCGQCGSACTSGSLCCAGGCVDPQADNNNCGNCGVTCSGGRSCTAGTCACKDTCNGQCADLQNDTQHCGKCGNTCKAGDVCTNGVCETPCPTGESKCATGGTARTCHNLKQDPDHCGACGNTCGTTEACSAGACTSSCPSGQKVCARSCTDVQSDSANCGACGNQCTNGKTCQSGACTCPSNKEICDNNKDDNCDGTIDEGCHLAISLGSANDESIIHLEVDANGNMYIVGLFSASLQLGSVTLTKPASQINQQTFIAKLDKTGKVHWAITPSGSQVMSVAGLAIDKLGNAYITGYFYNGLELTSTIKAPGYGGKDVYVAAISASGQWKWASSFGNPEANRNDESAGIAINSKGEIYITGHLTHAPTWTNSDRKVQFSNGTINLGTNKDYYEYMYIAKLSAAGTWTSIKLASHQFTYGLDIAIDQQDNLYVAGHYSTNTVNFGTYQLTRKGGREIFIAQMASSGAWKWAYSLGSADTYDATYGLTASNSGVIVFGYCQGDCTYLGQTVTKNKHFMAKFSQAGKAMWFRENTTQSGGHKLSAMNDAGQFYILNGTKLHYFDAAGKQLSTQTLLPTAYANGMKLGPTGLIYVYGAFSQPETFRGTSLTSKGKQDAFLLRF